MNVSINPAKEIKNILFLKKSILWNTKNRKEITNAKRADRD
tara:strand:- start:370 stop:492 length:123 start_codon:yes stop_codon:yes gene_type:complete